MSPMSDLVGAATKELRRALTPVAQADWSVAAGDLEWSCRQTAGHIADDLFSYASQVLARPAAGYLPVEAVVEERGTNAEVLDVVVMCGDLLRLAVEAAPREARAWHPCGVSDPDGFAAMGILETLVHGYDITRGLGVEWLPPEQLCGPVLERLFPDAQAGSPAQVLLHCAGRLPLGDRPRLAEWRWDSTVRVGA